MAPRFAALARSAATACGEVADTWGNRFVFATAVSQSSGGRVACAERVGRRA